MLRWRVREYLKQWSDHIPHLDRLGHHIHPVTLHPGVVFILQRQAAAVAGALQQLDDRGEVDHAVIPARLQLAPSSLAQMDMTGVGAEWIHVDRLIALRHKVGIIQHDFERGIPLQESQPIEWTFQHRLDVRLEQQQHIRGGGQRGKFIHRRCRQLHRLFVRYAHLVDARQHQHRRNTCGGAELEPPARTSPDRRRVPCHRHC